MKYTIYVTPQPYVYENVEAKNEEEARRKGERIAKEEYIDYQKIEVIQKIKHA